MRSSSAILLALCFCLSNTAGALSFSDFFGPRLNGVQTTRTALAPKNALDSIHRWNTIAINASGLDHTPLAPGEIRTFGEQLGPGRASRAMAIVHIAIFDSVNAVLGGYQSYTGIQPGKPPVSLDAAVAQAAHDTLVVQSASQFRVPPPPAMNSADYATAYAEAKSVGGDGVFTPTTRTPEQSFIGIFWAYDGTPSLCAPPRLYNQIIVHIADQMHLGTADLARLLALANTAMADAGMSIWESKYYYDFWRPVGGICESDLGTGPTGLGDGHASTTGDLIFTPQGAPT